MRYVLLAVAASADLRIVKEERNMRPGKIAHSSDMKIRLEWLEP